MTEQDPRDPLEHAEETSRGIAPIEPTGHPAVDRVLEDLEGLEQRPLDEHVSRFEAAQSALRSVLDGPGRDGPPVPGPR